MLKVRNLSIFYGTTLAVDCIDLDVREGELVTLIGANGAGKTSTLRAISGLEQVSSGRIELDGENITNCAPKSIIEKGIAHCPEGRRVFPQMTVGENLRMGAYARRDINRINHDLEHMLEKFPRLRERFNQAAGTLSGGEQQMLAIARAMMSRPRLILFDEPSLGLAPNLVEQVFEMVLAIRESGTTVLMVEQNAYAALEMCDRSYLLENGHVAHKGTAQEMIKNPEIRKAYLGG
jgi:branched-chain amino acid transport system ATP-binding protein